MTECVQQTRTRRQLKTSDSTNKQEWYDSHRSKKDSCSVRKAPTTQNDNDFKPCHVYGAESKHSYDECSRNPKNASATNKSNYYVKKCKHDTHYKDNRRLSSRDKSPSECDTPVPSDGEVDDESSDSSRSALNYHIDASNKTHKKRWLVEPKDVGHKSPASKKRKSLVEPDLAIKGKLYEKQISPKKLRPSKSDGDHLNLYDDDVMSDNAKSSLSITNDNGLSFANLDEDDAFGFDN